MPEFTPIPTDDAPRVESLDGHRLALVKGGHRTVFHCPPGQEPQLLLELRGLVADPSSDLNWFDAAVLSHEVGQRLSERLTQTYRQRRPA